MDNKISPVRNEVIFEIRFKPNSKILDRRGQWAEAISAHLKLPHWQIVENRVDIYDDDETIHAFVGFRNGGLTALDVPNGDYFPNYASNFLSFVFGLQDFGDPILVERIGVRFKFCTAFSGSFDELKDRFAKRYITLTEQAINAIGNDAKLIDIGGPLNFVDSVGNFNTMSGPMPKKQFPNFFTRKEGFPEVGLFYDIDYWLRPNKEINSKKIIEHIGELSHAAWDRHSRIRDLLLKG